MFNQSNIFKHKSNIRPAHQFLPHWESEGKIFRSKLLANIHATQKNGYDVTFHFNDDILSQLNWMHEPPHTIDYYYKLRAESIRDQYDYIVLMYSGGSDSTTILKTFMRNNIKIDEVATYGIWNHSIDKYYTLDNLEITFAATELLKECANSGIKVAHLNLLDGIEQLSTDDWIWHSDPLFSASQAVRYPVVYGRTELSDMIISGKKVAVILGHDKPRILYKNGGLHYGLCDMGGIGTGIFPQFFDPNYNGPTVELFHTNVAVPEIMIKQSHMVANWYRSNFGNHCKILLDPETLDPLFNSRVNTIVYPTTWRETETYTIGKGKIQSGAGLKINPLSSNLMSYEWRSEWLYSNLSDSHYAKNWYSGVNKALSMMGDCFVDRTQGKLHGTWTKFYKIMDFD
jgi:hypothetical protein